MTPQNFSLSLNNSILSGAELHLPPSKDIVLFFLVSITDLLNKYFQKKQ
jgi:hypothetical protein